jgi:biopolymer transport protein ExbB
MWEFLVKGGMFMVPLVLSSIIGLAIVLDRWFYLRSVGRESTYVLDRVDEFIRKDDIPGLEAFCASHGGLLAAVFTAGTSKRRQLEGEPDMHFVQQEISKSMEDASIANTSDLERRLPILASVGNVAPLFGFAGTVTGMMRAFRDIAATANPTAQVVAAGIEEALITTAEGLIIAIPAVLFHNFFMARIDAINARVEESANSLLDELVMLMVRERQKHQING